MACSKVLWLMALLRLSVAANAAAFFLQGASLASFYYPQHIAEDRNIDKDGAKDAAASVAVANEQPNVSRVLESTAVLNPSTGKACPALEDQKSTSILGEISFQMSRIMGNGKKTLVVVMPQFGDPQSMEYAQYLRAVMPDLERANIALRIVGIGNCKAAQMFSLYTGIPLECIRVDPSASIHSALLLSRGPDWDIPNWIPQGFLEWFVSDVCGLTNKRKGNSQKYAKKKTIDARQVARSWLNCLAQHFGIGTLKEISRGFLGDKEAPERISPDEKIRAGPITIHGTSSMSVRPFLQLNTNFPWRRAKGHLRPGELASCRLRSLMEVWSKYDDYVSDPRFMDWRGGTYLLDANSRTAGKCLYEHKDKGLLQYSETMDRPLSFLSNYIGYERARNPFGLRDPEFIYEDDEY